MLASTAYMEQGTQMSRATHRIETNGTGLMIFLQAPLNPAFLMLRKYVLKSTWSNSHMTEYANPIAVAGAKIAESSLSLIEKATPMNMKRSVNRYLTDERFLGSLNTMTPMTKMVSQNGTTP